MLFIALSLSRPRFPPTLGLAYYTSEKETGVRRPGAFQPIFLTDHPMATLIIARVSSTAKWNEA